MSLQNRTCLFSGADGGLCDQANERSGRRVHPAKSLCPHAFPWCSSLPFLAVVLQMESYLSALGGRLDVNKSNAAKMVAGVQGAAQGAAAKRDEIAGARKAASAAHLAQLLELRTKAEATTQNT